MSDTNTGDLTVRERLQRAIDRLPRVRLAPLPTPLEDCPRLSEALDGPRILIKRDDLTGLAFGGNKTRELEFTLGPAKEEGADVLIHGAASQSNMSRQTAAAAAKLGMKAIIVARRDAKSQEGIQGNLLLDHLLGAEVRLVEGDRQGQVKQQLVEELRAKGHKPYEVTSHNWILGTVAYVNCALELCDQLDELGLAADYVFLCSGNHGQVGLVLGGRVLGAGFQVIGMRAGGGDNNAARPVLANLGNEVAEYLGLSVTVSPEEMTSLGDYAGEGYGVVTKEGCEAIRLVAQTEGILLDPVYTGKAMAGLMDYIRRGRIRADETVVFVHTGGTPALFAYNRELIGSQGHPIT